MRRGFMCQSRATTAVGCMPDDMRSVIVPCNKSNGRYISNSNNVNKYTRLVDKSNERLLKDNNKRRENLSSLLSDRNKVKVKGDHQPPVSYQQQKPKSLQNCSSGATHHLYQVVVLRVSLHCQGCAGKVKKHLSKMEGVTSFNIDLETKRVTVMGNVSPARVLENISKIKRAEFWTC